MNKYRWDLEYLLENKTLEELYKETFSKVDEVVSLKNTAFDNIENFRNWHKTNAEMMAKLFKTYNYISNKLNENVNDAEASGWYQKFSNDNNAKLDQKVSDLKNIILSNKDKIVQYLKNDDLKHLSHYYKEIFKYEKHTLSDKEELLLTTLSMPLSAPEDIFGTFINGDMKFNDVLDSENKPHKLTRANRSLLLQNPDRVLRKNSYLEYAKENYKYRNTLAKTLYYNYLSLNQQAKIRKHDDYISRAAFDDSIDKDFIKHVYSSVQKYKDMIIAPLKKVTDQLYSKKLKIDIDNLEPWDKSLPIYTDKSEYTIEEAQEIVLDALKPLGEEYLSIIKRAYEEKWVDYEARDGKRGGAYSIGGTYGISKYFILMNFDKTFRSVETLAHELGHSVNSYYLSQKQPFEYADVSIFTAEIASVANEAILLKYMLSKEENSDLQKIDLMLSMVGGFLSTTSRQVSFSEFEWRANDIINNNESFTADSLMNVVRELSEKYYPEKKDKFKEMPYAMVDVFELTVPHFYTSIFYVYKYAIGQVVGTIVANKILSKEEGFAEKYKEFLSSGTSKSPLETIKILGIDLTKSEPWEEAGKFIQGILKELGDLVEKTEF